MNGKGSKPRNNFSRQFRENFDEINWGERKEKSKPAIERAIEPAPRPKMTAAEWHDQIVNRILFGDKT